MLLQLQDTTLAFSGPPVLDQVNLEIQAGERICLLGRNGTGKSTLMRVIEGSQEPDSGRVLRRDGLRVARMEQDVPGLGKRTVREVVAEGLGQAGVDLQRWEALSVRVSTGDGDDSEFEALQHRIEQAGGWQLAAKIDAVLSRLELDGSLPFDELSGGRRRRVLLARALVDEPDLLLLDEPTNHLDIDSVDKLERMLLGYRGTVLFITHDRAFLRRLATRILELDRGRLTSWPGNYDKYLERREATLEAEQQQQERFDRKLAQEEAWIRQGIKARRTRNEGRVRALKAMRAERAQRRERQGNVRMQAASAGQSGRKVIEAENVSFAWDGRAMVKDFSTTIFRGDRIGLIGPNGSGKSTLLKLMLGQLDPDAGEIRLGTGLEIAYFDQHRSVLREDWNAAENVAEGRDFVEINGGRKHVIGYLQDFLFTPERARAPITRLSGGERNRLLLARLFARPSNLLVMDEPTNDLDVETLELLEEVLADYTGTLLLVSHDRDFLDNVITASLVMEGEGRVGEYIGGYSDWLRQRARAVAMETSPEPELPAAKPASPKPKPRKAAKLSYKLARELEQLPGRVEALETRMAELTERMNDPDFFRQDAEAITRLTGEVESVQAELDLAYARWEELEARQA